MKRISEPLKFEEFVIKSEKYTTDIHSLKEVYKIYLMIFSMIRKTLRYKVFSYAWECHKATSISK